MRHTTFPSLPLTILCAIPITACNPDLPPHEEDSATGDCDFFNCTDGATDTEIVPTEPTSASASDSEPTGEPPVDPEDCELNPSEDFEGFQYICSGSTAINIAFDYYGDPDLPIGSFFVCVDETEPPFNEVKDEGYVFTCFRSLSDFEFGPDINQPNGEEVDACCLREASDASVEGFCTVDAGEELCSGAAKELNELRKMIPPVAPTKDLRDQLEALNAHISEASTQEACSQEVATELLDESDQFPEPEAAWHPGDDSNWSWFREIVVTVPDFAIDGNENSGNSCSEINLVSPMSGQITGGKLKVKSFLGNANTKVTGGSFKFRTAPCDLETCEFRFDEFHVKIKDFDVGPLGFSQVKVDLLAPTMGQINAPKIGFANEEMHFTATFNLSVNGEPMFVGAAVELSNSGVAEARLQNGPKFGVQKIDAVDWPFEFTLTTDLAVCSY